ncbi:MAG: ribose-phosphate diphosphokinase [Candidatus Babeliales bacterium]|jgi:ribose-phosphate pyrophosphokinase
MDKKVVELSTSLIVIGQPWSLLTNALAQRTSSDLVPLTVATFADTETFVSLENGSRCAGKHVILVYQFMHFDQHKEAFVCNGINDQLLGVLQAIDLLHQMKASSIDVVMPYFPYARQEISVDKNYQGAVFMLGRCYKALGVRTVIACDVHAPIIQRSFPVAINHIQLTEFWFRVVRDHILQGQPSDQLCVASPDAGGHDRAQALAALLNVPCVMVNKKRIANDQAVSYELTGDVNHKRVIILDDIIDTAHTALGACDLLLEHGARAIYGCFTHAIFSQGAGERLDHSNFEKIFVSDSIFGLDAEQYKKIQIVSLHDYLAKILEPLLRGL